MPWVQETIVFSPSFREPSGERMQAVQPCDLGRQKPDACGLNCTQPLMHKLGFESTARASFCFYNIRTEVDRLVVVLREIQKFFGN